MFYNELKAEVINLGYHWATVSKAIGSHKQNQLYYCKKTKKHISDDLVQEIRTMLPQLIPTRRHKISSLSQSVLRLVKNNGYEAVQNALTQHRLLP